MSLFKRISFALLFLPLFLIVFSLVASQKAHAALYNLNLNVKIDADNNQKYGSNAIDPCYDGTFQAEITDSTGTHKTATFTSKTNCSGSVHVVKVNTTGSYRVKLITPGNTLNYIDGYYNSNNTHIQLNKALSAGRAITMRAGDNAVTFGLAPPYKLNVMYVLIDKNNNLSKDSGENCYTGGLTLKVDGVSKDWNNTNINTSIRKSDCTPKFSMTRLNQKVGVDIVLSSGANYTIKGLKYSDERSPNTLKYFDGAGITIQGDGTVYYFIKPKVTAPTSTPTPTKKPNAPDCNAKPGIKVDPIQQGGKPGKKLDYKVTVTNHDDNAAACKDKTSFALGVPGKPTDKWKVTFEKQVIEVSKGNKTASTLMYITSPDSATDGVKTITIDVARLGVLQPAHVQVKPRYNVLQPATPTKAPTKKPTASPTNPPTVCNPAKPQLNITADKTSVKPGGKITYTVKVKNVDEGPCDKRSLSLARTYPPNANLTGAFQPSNSFDIAKGVEKTFTLPVTSPSTATVGTKKVTIDLKNAGGNIINTKDVDFVISETTITPTNTPTPTEGPTPTPTCTPRPACLDAVPACKMPETSDMCPKSTPTPTPTPEEPTPTPIPGQTLLNMSIGLDGIGVTPRIPIGGNKNPIDNTLSISAEIFNAATNQKLGGAGIGTSFDYNPDTLRFEGSFALNNDTFVTGIYNIYARSPQSLFAQLPGSITITKGQTATIPTINLITGNITDQDQSENKIDLLDYNILISCSIYSSNRSACDQNQSYIKNSDLNDDGIVNEDDYTLFLKEFANQQGAILPGQ